ncbi:hypothetical protein FG93_00006 [Bosea sp. LC85]|uniref:hypothetical protein n=1 Tax=Bosea sp. LC85 TaxID=1502851 RepID=UPI0004E3A5B5|nr:hypothetical protein [Bosea sp. LC85]KFC75866.1 hypothetical protein FG93_00006 [Bosea sp. LC85]
MIGLAVDDDAAFAKLLAKFLAKPVEHPVMSRVANCFPFGAWYCWETPDLYHPIST